MGGGAGDKTQLTGSTPPASAALRVTEEEILQEAGGAEVWVNKQMQSSRSDSW